MGSYLSTPKKDKVSSEGSGGGLLYGASEMQGWRLGMEDAYIANPVFPEQLSRELALFAVFDGHGGSAVADDCTNVLLTSTRMEALGLAAVSNVGEQRRGRCAALVSSGAGPATASRVRVIDRRMLPRRCSRFLSPQTATREGTN